MHVRLATRGSDYAKCARGEPHPDGFEYPTIMAERTEKGELIGYLTTSTKTGYIVAGPLWISPKMTGTGRGLVLLRLMAGYENVLGMNGVDRFLFWIDPSDKHYIDTIEKAIGLKAFYVDANERHWFKKEIVRELV
jgi:hypothetical protein